MNRRYKTEEPMSPEDRDELDRLRWKKFDEMYYGMSWADYKEMMGCGLSDKERAYLRELRTQVLPILEGYVFPQKGEGE